MAIVDCQKKQKTLEKEIANAPISQTKESQRVITRGPLPFCHADVVKYVTVGRGCSVSVTPCFHGDRFCRRTRTDSDEVPWKQSRLESCVSNCRTLRTMLSASMRVNPQNLVQCKRAFTYKSDLQFCYLSIVTVFVNIYGLIKIFRTLSS